MGSPASRLGLTQPWSYENRCQTTRCRRGGLLASCSAGKGSAVTERSASPQPAPSVVRMSLWAVSAQLSITLLSAGTSIILNRTLGPEGRGAVALVQLWPVLLSGLA